MFRKAFITFVILTFLASPSGAIEWPEVLELTAKNNNDLIGSKKQMESSEWTYKKAYTNFLPQISANMSMTEDLTASGTSPAGSKTYSYGLNVSQSLFKGMDNIYGLESAYADYEYYKASFVNTEASVYYGVRSAFIELLVAEKNVELLTKIYEYRKENSDLIKLRYESGKEDKGNLMRTEADEDEAEYNLNSVKRDLKLAKLKLSQLLGEKVDGAEGKIELQNPPAVDFDELLKKTPSFVMAKYQLKSAEIAKKSTISGFLPNVSLSGRWNKSGDEWPPENENSSWSLSLSYSFFPGGSNFIDPIIYDLKLDKAKEDFENTVKDARYSLEEAYDGFLDSMEALKVKETHLEAAKERAKIARAKYLNGLMSYNDWDKIENDYVTAQRTVLSYKKAALMAEAAWYKSYGGYIHAK